MPRFYHHAAATPPHDEALLFCYGLVTLFSVITSHWPLKADVKLKPGFAAIAVGSTLVRTIGAMQTEPSFCVGPQFLIWEQFESAATIRTVAPPCAWIVAV
jgi:hypothetical protein